MEYSGPFYNCILTHIPEPCHINENLRISRTLTYLKPDTDAEPSQKFKMESFAKIVESIIIFQSAPS